MSTPIDSTKYGPWAVIAGGSEGVGASFADQLAAAGLNLVLLARKPGPLEETAESVRRTHGVEVRTLSVDLTDPDAIKQIAEVTEGLEVGLLVFNAGANTYGHEFVTGDLEKFGKVIDLNITAQLELVQLFGAPMKERRRGGILLVGSLAGFMGSAQISIYAAVKAFCRVFAEGLWLEMRDYDVDVVEFVLGVTRTPAMARAGLNFDIPGMHVSEPEDVARQAIAALTSGPVQIAEGNEKAVSIRSGIDRHKLVLGAHEASKKMLPPSHDD
ncbi:short-chain dehydrogenase [Nocardioides sp. Soil797]|nr:short-chain dehydrogenase [Nocardioides sp. Soil797]